MNLKQLASIFFISIVAGYTVRAATPVLKWSTTGDLIRLGAIDIDGDRIDEIAFGNNQVVRF